VHDLKHTFGHRLDSAGASDRDCQALLEHARKGSAADGTFRLDDDRADLRALDSGSRTRCGTKGRENLWSKCWQKCWHYRCKCWQINASIRIVN
jgi:hypothetical protein